MGPQAVSLERDPTPIHSKLPSLMQDYAPLSQLMCALQART